jgi:hypothetical protein
MDDHSHIHLMAVLLHVSMQSYVGWQIAPSYYNYGDGRQLQRC